jgi:hypothetical protein
MVELSGAMETETTKGFPMLTVAVPDCVGSERDVALTVTIAGLGATRGAVYKPSNVISPQVLPLQPDPVTDQTTTELEEPLT